MPRILGVGTDLLNLTRFRRALERRSVIKMAQRICSPSELEAFSCCDSPDGMLRFLALR